MPKTSIVCFTGFEPFGPHVVNPSWSVALTAAATVGRRVAARAVLLPVTFDATARFAADLVRAPQAPELVVHLGLAEMRTEVSIERAAHNRRDAREDNDGAVAPGALVPGAAEIFSDAPLATSLAEAWPNPSRVAPTLLSDDAGEFVCNALYFHALRATADRDTRVSFVHVPAVDAAGAVTLGSELGTAVLRILEAGAAST